MDFKELFKQLFPTKDDFRSYRRWRAERKKETERQRSIRRQERERQAELLAMDDDVESDDYDPIGQDVWQEASE